MFLVESRYINKFFWLWILITVIIAFIFPNFGYIIKPLLVYLLMGVMFLSSLKIEFFKIIKDLTIIKKIESIFIHLMIIHVVTPILVVIFKPYISIEAYIGFILAAVTSSAIAIVFLATLFGGKPRISLEITTISNLLNVVAVPVLVLAFAGKYVKVDYLSVFILIFQLVVIPLILAQLTTKTYLKDKLLKISSPLSILLLLLIIYGIIAPTSSYILQNIAESVKLFGISIVILIAMFLIGYATGKDKKERITYAIASSFKNATLSTVIALTLFDIRIALAPIVYTVATNVLLAPAYLIFAKKK